MKLVGSADNHGVELRSRRVSELRAELILQNRQVLDRVVGNGDQRTCNRPIVVVHSFDAEVVIPGTLSAYRRAGAGAESAARGDSRIQQRKIQDSRSRSSYRSQRHILHLPDFIRVLQLRRARVEDWGFRCYFNHGGNFARSEYYVCCCGLVQLN